jgi:L-fuculose-phosphate aldolase
MASLAKNPKPNEGGGMVDRLSTTYQHLMGKKAKNVTGPTRLESDVRDIYAPALLRQEMLDSVTSIAHLDLVAGPLGEASIRLDRDKFLVTRSGVWFAEIHDQDILLASKNLEKGLVQRGYPKHWDWHLCIYDQIIDAKAVLLAQPAASTAVAARGRLPETSHLKDLEEVSGLEISSGDTIEIAATVQRVSAILIPGFGVLAYAETLQKAIAKILTVNRLCEIELLVRSK